MRSLLRNGGRLALRAVCLLSLAAAGGGCPDIQARKAANARDEVGERPESPPQRDAPGDVPGAGDPDGWSVSAELRGAIWKGFQESVENYRSQVRRSNTSPLRDAADAYAEYLAQFHRHLHYAFASRFLRSLPPEGELADPALVSQVEIVVNADGSLHDVGIVRSSGSTRFDFGSYLAVLEGAPYPSSPAVIRSSDGRVYLRWSLHRDTSQCGLWNAHPLILRQVVPDDLPHVLPVSARLQRERAEMDD